MQSFKELITELFDKPFDWEWAGNEYVNKDIFALFDTPDYSMAVDFAADSEDYEIGFGPYEIRESKRGDKTIKRIVMDTTPVLNTSYSSKIMATVLDITKEFIKKKDPKQLKIVADKESIDRADFYSKMIDRELPKDYDVSKEEDRFGVIFQIEKK